MKTLSVFMIALLLVGCGPSAEQMTATAVMAQAQTQTAAPTSTPTHTPTPTLTPTPTYTPTPVSTATPISSKSGVTISHSAPEESEPEGLPNAAVSDLFQTSSGGFNIQVPVGPDDPWKAIYFLSLTLLQEIPEDAQIEVHFANPLDPTTAIVIQQDGPFEDELFFVSPSLSGVECKNYWIEIHVYSDASQTTELGTHLQWVRSNFNVDKMKDINDLFSTDSCNR